MAENSTYVTLVETNGKHYECWYYFIKYEGNEEAIQHLEKQLNEMEPMILEDLSFFDIDTEHRMSEKTAKEMTSLEVNHVMFHRKFDGTLKKIDFGFKKKDSNNKKIIKVFNILGIGGISNFIDKEDVEEVENGSASESDSSGTEYFYSDSSSSSSSSSSSEGRKKKKKNSKEDNRKKLVEKIKKMKEERGKKEK